jgi:hypothetical protein
MYQSNFKIPQSIYKLFKIILRAFYSDLHIVTIDILLKLGYVSEFVLLKECNIEIEKIRMVTNSLLKENFIKHEDRIFKKIKFQKENKNKKNLKIYKLRFWFIDFNSTILKIKEKIKKIFINQSTVKKTKKKFYLHCPRKICQKQFSNIDLSSLPFNHITGKFNCNNFLNLKIICGEELIEKKDDYFSPNLENVFQEKKIIFNELKPIIILILSSIKTL